MEEEAVFVQQELEMSLLNSAFLFVKGSLPWFDDVLNSSKESEAKEFKERFALFRLKHRKKHAE